MSDSSLFKLAVNSAIWNTFNVGGVQVLSFIFSMILARVLSPEDYGLFAILMIWVVVGDTVSNAGLGASIVSREKLSGNFLNTVFWLNMIIGLAIVFILSLVNFLTITNIEIETLIVIALIILMNASVVVPLNKLIRDFEYRKRTLISVVGISFNGLISILLARLGLGYLALFGGLFASKVITTILLFWLSKWSPAFDFKSSEVKQIMGFGLPLLGVSLNESLYKKLDEFIINTTFGLSSTGLMVKAKSLVGIANLVALKPLATVVFPLVSKMKGQKQLSSFLFFLISMMALPLTLLSLTSLSFSERLILLAYGSNWIDTVGLFQILSLGMVAYPINGIIAQFYKGMGKTKSMYRVDIIIKGIGLCLLLMALIMKGSLYYFAYAIVITQHLSVFINLRFLNIDYQGKFIKIFYIFSIQILSFLLHYTLFKDLFFGVVLNGFIIIILYRYLIGISILDIYYILKKVIIKNEPI